MYPDQDMRLFLLPKMDYFHQSHIFTWFWAKEYICRKTWKNRMEILRSGLEFFKGSKHCWKRKNYSLNAISSFPAACFQNICTVQGHVWKKVQNPYKDFWMIHNLISQTFERHQLARMIMTSVQTIHGAKCIYGLKMRPSMMLINLLVSTL